MIIDAVIFKVISKREMCICDSGTFPIYEPKMYYFYPILFCLCLVNEATF
jgi:hypothetical protein